MARPLKHGLEYFPLDVDFDDKISDLVASCGRNAKLIYIELLQSIYKTDNAELDISSEIRLNRIAKESEIGVSDLRKILDVMAEIGLIDREAYSRHVLTSNGVKKRFRKVEDQREARRGWSEKNRTSKTDVKPNIEAHNEVTTIQNTSNVVQNPPKESKAKHSTAKESTAVEATAPPLPSGDDGKAILAELDQRLGRKDIPTGSGLEQFLLQQWGRFGKVSNSVMTSLVSLGMKHGYDKLFYAIEEGAKHNACSLAYVQAILEPKKSSIDRNLEKFVQMGAAK